MKKYIEELGISYMVEGEGQPLVIFHGWGCNKEMFQFLTDHYRDRYRVYSFDLPGFGSSREPEIPLDTKGYADVMAKAFEILGISNPVAIGHSFGGRVLIQMAVNTDISKMVLTGSAGVVNPKPLSYYVKVYTYKTLKRLYQSKFIELMFPNLLDKYRKNAGSSDYNKASETMKRVLSIVVNEDLRHLFKDIDTPTLLVWGEKDTATPVSDGQLMEENMRDAGLVIFEGGTHYAFLEQKARFLRVLDAFI